MSNCGASSTMKKAKRGRAEMKKRRRDARVAEEARLESVYTSKAYPGFESPSLRCDTFLRYLKD